MGSQTMALGNAHSAPKGDADYFIGSGGKGNERPSSVMVTRGDGQEEAAPYVTHPVNAGRSRKAALATVAPQEGMPAWSTPIYDEPMRRVPFDGQAALGLMAQATIIMGDDFDSLVQLRPAVCLSSKLKPGGAWRKVVEGREVYIVSIEDWRAGVQQWVSQLIPEKEGPLEEALMEDEEIATLFPDR